MKTVTVNLTEHDRWAQVEEIMRWCFRAVGPGEVYVDEFVIPNNFFEGIWYPEHSWQAITSHNSAKFTFRQDQDATMFSLRWS